VHQHCRLIVRGGEEHDGTPLPGLGDPAPLDAELSPEQ